MKAVKARFAASFLACASILASAAPARPSLSADTASAGGPRWRNGPSEDPAYFPIAVWLQSPANAGRYKAAGINTYVGLWEGPTEAQLAELGRQGMRVICAMNETGKRRLDDPVIMGWMLPDEPDNAQPSDPGYGPPIPPEAIVAEYRRIKAIDPTRPVFLNLGQGVAWDGWYGRGARTGHPEDYPRYLQGCDIASFDIYPATHPSAAVSGKLWYVARGVSRLVKWGGAAKRVWNCVESTRVENPRAKPSPDQLRFEVWSSIIHGSTGIIYFAHQFQPTFVEAALLEDAETLEAVAETNARIAELAPVLNGGDAPGLVSVRTVEGDCPIAFMSRIHEGSLYIFAAAMDGSACSAAFRVKGLGGHAAAQVLGGGSVEIADGVLEDLFPPWGVRIYRIALPKGETP